jgi:protein-disulfide isomerase
MSSNERSRSAGARRRERRLAGRAERRVNERAIARGGTRGGSNGGPSIALITTVLAVVAGLAIIAVIALSQGVRPGAPAGGSPNPAGGLTAPTAVVPADLGDAPFELGSPNAPLTMQVTSDFQCPICDRFATQYLPQLITDFIRPGLLRIQMRDVEFLDRGDSTESLDSATAAACAAEQGRYWEYHDWLFANQEGENQGAFALPRLQAIADRIELDRSAFDACMSASTERSKVTANTNAALAAGISSTPTFVINGGQPIKGLPQYDQFAAYLRSLLPSGAPASPSPSK